MCFDKYSGRDVLAQIPGVNSWDIETWLYWARRLSPSELTYRDICRYIDNSQCHPFGIEVLDIIRVRKMNDLSLHESDPKNPNRMLLWHGAPAINIASILQHGFQLPTDKNQMFGTGLYFADRSSKSANYSAAIKHNPDIASGEIGYMFLCDVSVGTMYNAKKVRHHANSPPTYLTRAGREVSCDTVKCTGEYVPDSRGQKKFRMSEAGAEYVIPYGRTIKNPNPNYEQFTVQYNEYVVYQLERCKPNHLIKFKFTRDPVQNEPGGGQLPPRWIPPNVPNSPRRYSRYDGSP